MDVHPVASGNCRRPLCHLFPQSCVHWREGGEGSGPHYLVWKALLLPTVFRNSRSHRSNGSHWARRPYRTPRSHGPSGRSRSHGSYRCYRSHRPHRTPGTHGPPGQSRSHRGNRCYRSHRPHRTSGGHGPPGRSRSHGSYRCYWCHRPHRTSGGHGPSGRSWSHGANRPCRGGGNGRNRDRHNRRSGKRCICNQCGDPGKCHPGLCSSPRCRGSHRCYRSHRPHRTSRGHGPSGRSRPHRANRLCRCGRCYRGGGNGRNRERHNRRSGKQCICNQCGDPGKRHLGLCSSPRCHGSRRRYRRHRPHRTSRGHGPSRRSWSHGANRPCRCHWAYRSHRCNGCCSPRQCRFLFQLSGIVYSWTADRFISPSGGSHGKDHVGEQPNGNIGPGKLPSFLQGFRYVGSTGIFTGDAQLQWDTPFGKRRLFCHNSQWIQRGGSGILYYTGSRGHHVFPDLFRILDRRKRGSQCDISSAGGRKLRGRCSAF